MNALLSQAASLRAQAHTLAEQALFGDLFASTSTETIDQLNAQADELEAQAAAPAPAPALAVNDDVEVEPSPAEQLNAIFADLLSPVSEPVAEPAEMDLVAAAFDQHWRHDGGACMIELSEFKAHQPRDLDAYTCNGSLYYSDGSLAWSIALEYLD